MFADALFRIKFHLLRKYDLIKLWTKINCSEARCPLTCTTFQSLLSIIWPRILGQLLTKLEIEN